MKMDECANNCGGVVDEEDNTITFMKKGEKITGRVCMDCYYNLKVIYE